MLGKLVKATEVVFLAAFLDMFANHGGKYARNLRTTGPSCSGALGLYIFAALVQSHTIAARSLHNLANGTLCGHGPWRLERLGGAPAKLREHVAMDCAKL